MYIYIYMNIYIHTSTHIYTHTYMFIYLLNIYMLDIYVHAKFMYIYSCILNNVFFTSLSLSVCIYIHVYIYIYIYSRSQDQRPPPKGWVLIFRSPREWNMHAMDAYACICMHMHSLA